MVFCRLTVTNNAQKTKAATTQRTKLKVQLRINNHNHKNKKTLCFAMFRFIPCCFSYQT